MYDSRDYDQALSATGWAPLPGPPAGFGEALDASLASFRALDRSDSADLLLAEVAGRHLEPWAKAGLVQGNPLASGAPGDRRVPAGPRAAEAEGDDGAARLYPGLGLKSRASGRDELRALARGGPAAAWDELRAELEGRRELAPTLAPPPSYDELRDEARALARERYVEAARVAARALSFGPKAGAAAGAMWGALGDPVNVGALPLGLMTGGGATAAAGFARGLLTTAAREALAGAAAEAAIQPAVQSWRGEVGVEHGLGEGLANVGLGAAAGGGLTLGLGLLAKGAGLGISGTLRGWQAAKGAFGRAAERGPLKDAERVLEASAGYLDAAPGPGPGLGSPAAAETAHLGALAHAEAAVLAGEAPGGPVVDQASRLAGAGRAAGPDGAVYTPTGRRVAVRYELVELDSLLPSHLDDLTPNPRYLAELQPRERERAASRAQIAGIAADLAPERLGRSAAAGEGAPIVGPDGMVESGNGRVLALRKARNEGLPGWRRYREWLAAEGHDTHGMRDPVLIARRVEAMDPEQRALFAREANAPPNLTMGAAERAASDARLVPDSVLGLWKGGDVDSAANRDFRRAVAGHLPETERGALATADGTPSQDGIRRLQALLLAKAYPDPHLLALMLEATDSDIRAIGGALIDVAGPWARLRALTAAGQVEPAMDITAQLLEAVALVRKARQEGTLVRELLDQRGLFGDLDPVTDLLVRLLFRDEDLRLAAGRGRVVERLQAYLAEAEKATPGPGLFGELEPVTPRAILGQLLGRPVPPGPVDLGAAAATVRASEDALAAAEKLDAGREAGVLAEGQRLASVPPARPADGTPVATLTGRELETFAGVASFADDRAMRSAVRAFFDQKLRPITVQSPDIGSVRFVTKGLRKVLSSSADVEKLRLLPAVPSVIEHGTYGGRTPVTEPRADRVVAFHWIEGDVEIGGRTVHVGITVLEDQAGNKFYNVNVDPHRLKKAGEAPGLSRLHDGGGQTPLHGEVGAGEPGGKPAEGAESGEAHGGAPERTASGGDGPNLAIVREEPALPEDPLLAEAREAAAADPDLVLEVGVELAEDGSRRTVYRPAAEVLAELADEKRAAAELAACAVATFGKGVLG